MSSLCSAHHLTSASRRVWVTQKTQDPGMAGSGSGLGWHTQSQPGAPRCTPGNLFCHHLYTCFEETLVYLCYLQMIIDENYQVFAGAGPGGVRKRGPHILSRVLTCANVLSPLSTISLALPTSLLLHTHPPSFCRTHYSPLLWHITPSR